LTQPKAGEEKMPRVTPIRGHALRLVVYHVSTELGGLEEALATLLRHLNPMIEVLLIGNVPSLTRWFADQVPELKVRHVAGVRGKWDFRGMLNHMRMIRELKPDILQVELSTPWSGKYAVLAGLLAPRTRVIVDEHTGSPPRSGRDRWAKRILMAGTDANVAVSNELARFIEDAAGLKRRTIRVIYQGISDPGPPAARRQRHDPPVIGTIGRLTRQKGIDIFLRALADIPHVRGVIVGDGEDTAELKELAADLGVGQRVSWMGWREDARRFVDDFDIFVLASRWEGFGRVLVEAAFAECPVISTRVVGTSEAMIDGETGLLVPPEDKDSLVRAIITLLEDEERAREMGRRGREFALSRFDPATSAQEYEHLYDEIMARTS
jgi:glycosyltransferase involved in cell wall biosynthesis